MIFGCERGGPASRGAPCHEFLVIAPYVRAAFAPLFFFTLEFFMRSDTAIGRDLVTRWRMLAERRLNYLIELYESGRWKIYHSEPEFLTIVQEARAALKTWELLAPPDPVLDKPVEVAVAQDEDCAPPALPFVDLASANGVGAKDDLRKS